MIIKNWDALPHHMQSKEVKIYYDILKTRKISLIIKRIFDLVLSLILMILLLPVFLIIALIIKCDSTGPVFFRQERVTKYHKIFKIFKFRTMVTAAEKLGSQVTVQNDIRITKVGRILRKVRLDEIPQLINILVGDMSFVGTRPEVLKYVDRYDKYMNATFLMPAGVTSLASIEFKDEETLLNDKDTVDDIYVSEVLPLKMEYNLKYLKEFNFFYDIKILFKTVLAVIK